MAKRPPAIITPNDWRKGWWHGVAGYKQWRTTPEGILRRGDEKPIRTQYKPSMHLAADAWRLHGDDCRAIAAIFDLDPRLLIATICAESGVSSFLKRYEAHVGDTSYGLTQLLTGTAYQAAKRVSWPSENSLNVRSGFGIPGRPVSIGGKVPASQWGEFLQKPWNNIALCAVVHMLNNSDMRLKFDPVLMYAAYNSGGVYASSRTQYGIHYHPSAIEALILFFNDASATMPDVSG